MVSCIYAGLNLFDFLNYQFFGRKKIVKKKIPRINSQIIEKSDPKIKKMSMALKKICVYDFQKNDFFEDSEYMWAFV